MDKSCRSSAEPTASAATTTSSSSSSSNGGNTNRDQYLTHLHKISHRISKPTIKNPPFHPLHQQNQRPPPPPPPPPPPSLPVQPQPVLPSSQSQSLQQQNQPPVYNINKNDFREVVQKLTGSPAHERISAPPPIHAPKPPSSRLQRIRPPPLAQIGIGRPPPLLNCAVLPPQSALPLGANPSASAGGGSGFWGNSVKQMGPPLSPLPPLPTCHAAAESPISAYMRFLQNSISSVDSDPKRASGIPPFPPLASPKFNDLSMMNPQIVAQQPLIPPPPAVAAAQSGMPPPPSSPLPFGCFPSPKSPNPLLSPSMLFSPTGTGQFGFPQLPISPRLLPPVPSPK